MQAHEEAHLIKVDRQEENWRRAGQPSHQQRVCI